MNNNEINLINTFSDFVINNKNFSFLRFGDTELLCIHGKTEGRTKDLYYFGEFGPEMMMCLPYAYWLYTQNSLKSTTTCPDTHCFYYFSPHHSEITTHRTIDRVAAGHKNLPTKREILVAKL